jgi:hypothetical protein
VVVAMIVLAHTGKLSLGSQPSKQGQARPGRGRVRAINSPGEPLGSHRHSDVLPAVDGVGHRYARLVVHSRLSVLGITQSGLPVRWHIGVLQIDSPCAELSLYSIV